ncbi:hypothetical protein J5Y09_17860 [Roseomonas sp. PWR1]|uniref:Uncharacterized protein n=1 Tax=Roseomonas nitratireducens TaxID=2820810 RepID=A0ABS4AWR0_9PROT|nr:hypothetical protein [Neoroseomonas nitratireducens]MBP0465798.1 hypothetical protein [Neoroseomonas nitratireducens]
MTGSSADTGQAGGWRVVDLDGKTVRHMASLPTPLPFSIVPGTIVSVNINELLMLVDIRFTWDAGSSTWVQVGQMVRLAEPPNEPDIWEVRRHWLRHFGWL